MFDVWMQRQTGVHRPAAVLAGADVEMTTEQLDTFPHADKTVPATGRPRPTGGSAVVEDMEAEMVVFKDDANQDRGLTGMAQCVGQRLLQDAVGEQVHRRVG